MREVHPYGVFIPAGATAFIVGSFPIGKFSDPARRSEIKAHELDFFFGGETNLLWKLLGRVAGVELTSPEEIRKFLTKHGVGIGDVIESCVRRGGGASDSDLLDIHWNHDLLKKIQAHPIQTVYFTSKKVERWFQKLFPEHNLKTVTLISPSAQSYRSLPRYPGYDAWRKKHPNGHSFEFIVEAYKKDLRFLL